jgi:DNA-binding transcriptional ArsR family regulator
MPEQEPQGDAVAEQEPQGDAVAEQEPQGDAVAEQGAAAAGAGAERQRLEGEFLLAMRRNGSIMQLLGQMSAERIGINVTDLNCLNIVALAGPMTAGELARATGLTTASITGVLDRLEDGGFVRRERDPKDRRRVIVTLNPGPGLREIGPTFGPLVRAWRDAAAGYSDEELRLLLDFQRRFEGIVRDQLARLRGDLDRGARG